MARRLPGWSETLTRASVPFHPLQTLSSQLIIARELGVADDAGQITWIVAAFSMTAASFVLIGGRLSDIYGPRIIWQASMAWMMVWKLVTSFAKRSVLQDDVTRWDHEI